MLSACVSWARRIPSPATSDERPFSALMRGTPLVSVFDGRLTNRDGSEVPH